jgi:hypothetical protein
MSWNFYFPLFPNLAFPLRRCRLLSANEILGQLRLMPPFSTEKQGAPVWFW